MNDWTLVGRERELDLLAPILSGGSTVSAVLVGPGGVGKTRLASELIERAEAAGLATASARATRASADIPLGAIAPLLPQLGERTVNLLTAAREALARRAGGRPLVLFVDDAQLLDHMSASLVHHLAIGDGTCVVATVRSGEPVSDAITALWKDGHAIRIDVEELDDRHVDVLIDEALAGGVADATRAELQRVAAGNPLALRELVLGSIDAGALRQVDGTWMVDDHLTLSGRLADLVGERLAGLGDDERLGLELVALGEPIALDVLEQLIDDDALVALEKRGLVRVVREQSRDRVRLVHPLHGEVARRELGAVRRRKLVRRLSDAIVNGGGPDPHERVRVALWQLDSGAETTAGDCLAAARAAIVATDWQSASRLATAAFERERTFAAAHCAGYTLAAIGDHEEAEACLAVAEDLASGDRELVLAAMARSESLFRMGRQAEAEEVVLRSEGRVADRDWRAELVGHRATFVLMSGRPSEALDLTASIREEAMTELEGTAGDPCSLRPLVEAAISAVPALAWDARPVEAIALAERAHAAHTAIWDEQLFQSDPGIHIVGQVSAMLVAGRIIECEELARAALAYTAEAGDLGGQAWFLMLTAMALHYQGRLRDAVEMYEKSVSAFGATGVPLRQRWPLAGAASCRAQLGDIDKGETALVLADTPSRAANRLNEAALEEARAWICFARGEMEQGLSLLDRAADQAIEVGSRASAAIALHAMARVGRAERAVDRLGAIAEQTDSPLLIDLSTHVAAAAASDAAELDAVSDRLEVMGALLWAAEASADASRAWHRSGDPRRASAAEQRSRQLAHRCEGARTPALLQGSASSVLTKRELEVARLAAEGLPSKDIAERLYLSVRTVENHLQRSYEKLGVRGRPELAGALGIV